MDYSAWGSYEGPVFTDTGVLPVTYQVVARCDDGCHVMRHRVSVEHIEAARYLSGLWLSLERDIARAFKRVHP